MIGASDWVYTASTWVLPVLLAITLHEAAHAYAAYRLGDDTAHRMGRVSFNPLRHVDPFGTVILPTLLIAVQAGFLFGWAKPVPVDFGRLRRPRRDMVLVAAAGPASNVLLALAFGLSAHGVGLMPEGAREWLMDNILHALKLNVMLAVFNMLPLPPLDGGRVLVGLLPPALGFRVAKLERHGMLLLLGLMFLLPMIGDRIGQNLNVLSWVLRPAAEGLAEGILRAAGWY